MDYSKSDNDGRYTFALILLFITICISSLIYYIYYNYQNKQDIDKIYRGESSRKFSETFGLPIDAVDVNGNSAISRLARSASSEPCDWSVLNQLSQALSGQNQKRHAATLYEYYDRECARANNAVWMAANLYEQIGDHQSALKAIGRFIDLTSENPNGYYLRGRAYDEIGDKDKAISDYLTTISILNDPSSTNYSVFKYLSLAYESKGMNCEAASTIQMFIDGNHSQNLSQLYHLVDSYVSRSNCKDIYSKESEKFTQRITGNGVIFSDISINGSMGRFIVDTGASLVAVSKQFAQNSGIESRKGNEILLSTANGIARGNLVTIDMVRIGGVEAQKVQGVVMQADNALGEGIDGLLGRSFLARFDVSFERDTLSISTRK